MVEQIKKLLDNAVKRAGISRGVTAAIVCDEFTKVIRDYHGAEFLKHIKHASFRGGSLKIKCDEPVVAQNLRMNKIRIMNEINKKIGDKTVRELYALVF